MTKEHDNITDAKNSLKLNIDFMKILLTHLKGPNKIMRNRACFATWCIHRYFNEKLISDIQEAMGKNPQKDNGDVQ